MLSVGNAPLSWGVFEGDDDNNPQWRTVLDEIVEAGYHELELGPIGFFPEDPRLLNDELASRGLTLSGGFVYEHMHDPGQRQTVIRNTRRVGKMLSALGARYLVVIDRMIPERQRTAGRSQQAERLTRDESTTMFDTISSVAEIATDEFGLRPVLHPHAGTHIEFADEIDQALGELPHSTIGLCIDTAHSSVAGLEAAELVDRYAERVEYLHFKDVDGQALQRMIEDGLDFDEGLSIGLFCPIGQGVVDFAALRTSLDRAGFDGQETVEQDPDPNALDHSGLSAARASLEFLRQVGLARTDVQAEMDKEAH